jgi:RNA polymerase sigma-70 factor (ECF subfamily)
MTASFKEQFLEHLPHLRGYAMVLTRSRSAADDLLQETALRAWRAQSQYQAGTNIKAWLFCILRNEYISSLRRNKRAGVSLSDVAEEHFAHDGDQETNVMTVEVFKAMDRLSPTQREVLVLSCVNGLAYEEIAATLKCSVGTVKSRLFRARAQMQALLMGPDDAAPAFTEEQESPEPRHRDDSSSFSLQS